MPGPVSEPRGIPLVYREFRMTQEQRHSACGGNNCKGPNCHAITGKTHAKPRQPSAFRRMPIPVAERLPGYSPKKRTRS